MKDSSAVIRRIARDDIPSICRIENESFGDPWSPESFEYLIDSEYDYSIVVEYDGQIAGYAILRCSFDTADIINIAVDEIYRKKGFGRKLMENLLAYGHSTGVIRYMLEVRSSNRAAMRLYEKFGFEVCGVRKNYYSSPVEDGIVMCLEMES